MFLHSLSDVGYRVSNVVIISVEVIERRLKRFLMTHKYNSEEKKNILSLCVPESYDSFKKIKFSKHTFLILNLNIRLRRFGALIWQAIVIFIFLN